MDRCVSLENLEEPRADCRSLMDSPLLQATCFVGVLALLAFPAAAWMKRRTLYVPAPADTSQPISQEAEKKRIEKIRSKGALMVWGVWVGLCIAAYAVAILGPSVRKVSAALAPATPTASITFTATITATPTITNTPRDTFTPRPSGTPVGGASASPTPGSMLETVIPPTPRATQTPRVIMNVVVQTQIVRVNQTVIVPVQVTVPVTVIVQIPVTVIVTPTHTPTPTSTETQTLTPTPSETPSPTPTHTETPTP